MDLFDPNNESGNSHEEVAETTYNSSNIIAMKYSHYLIIGASIFSIVWGGINFFRVSHTHTLITMHLIGCLC